MKAYFLLTSVLITIVSSSCKRTNNECVEDNIQTEFSPILSIDTNLIKAYGADAYGMKSYVMAFLKAGPNRSQDSAKAMELQMAHLENINRLSEKGKLVLAGPFLDTGEIRGIYIFNVQSIKEAEELTKTDPAIQAGRLVMELKPWYGSAGLMGLNEIHEKLQTKGITE